MDLVSGELLTFHNILQNEPAVEEVVVESLVNYVDGISDDQGEKHGKTVIKYEKILAVNIIAFSH